MGHLSLTSLPLASAGVRRDQTLQPNTNPAIANFSQPENLSMLGVFSKGRPMLEGSCDCGAVRYTVDGALNEVTECNCGICRRSGGLWAYYSPTKVTMTGPTDIY